MGSYRLFCRQEHNEQMKRKHSPLSHAWAGVRWDVATIGRSADRNTMREQRVQLWRHTCKQAHTHAHAHRQMHTHTHTNTYLTEAVHCVPVDGVHAFTHTHIYRYTIYIHTYTHPRVHTHTHTHTYIYIYSHIHTHIHTHKHLPR